MKTKLFALSLVSILVLGGAGCTKTEPVATTPASVPDNTAVVVAPKDCGEDLACGNELLSACNPGTFSAMDGRAKVTLTIKAKSGDNCVITNALSTVAMAGFIDEYDLNKDGMVDMDCNVPSTVKDFAALSAYVKTPAGILTCNGEMRTMNDSL